MSSFGFCRLADCQRTILPFFIITFSLLSKASFNFLPRLYPPALPSLLTTRWQGIFGLRFLSKIFPTARQARGRAARRATFLYVKIFPLGIFFTTFKTFSLNSITRQSGTRAALVWLGFVVDFIILPILGQNEKAEKAEKDEKTKKTPWSKFPRSRKFGPG